MVDHYSGIRNYVVELRFSIRVHASGNAKLCVGECVYVCMCAHVGWDGRFY